MLAPYALVMLRKDNNVLLLKRSATAKFAPDLYSLVGGAVEKSESFRDALVREAHEELGIVIKQDDLKFAHVFYRKGAAHELVACIFQCSVWQGEIVNKEPEKHSELAWFDLDNVPEKMIPAHLNALALIAQESYYSEQAPD